MKCEKVCEESTEGIKIVAKEKKSKTKVKKVKCELNGTSNAENIVPCNGAASEPEKVKKAKKRKQPETNGDDVEVKTVKAKKSKKNSEVIETAESPAKKLPKSEIVNGKKKNKKTNGVIESVNGVTESVNGGSENNVVNNGTVTDPGDFSNYRISPFIIEKLKLKGITSLFAVQTMSFDPIYDGNDVIVQARTGSGKTLCFAIPLVEKLLLQTMEKKRGRPPQVLVMAPTRELAKQVSDTFESISGELSVLCVYGGTHVGPQERALWSGVDVLVGTPGRIQDLITRGCLDLSRLSHVVLDEVDRMLDMGFADDVDAILQQRYKQDDVSCNPQTLLFSATLPHWIHETSKKYLRTDRKHLDLVSDDVVKTSKTVQHYAIRCSYFDRPAAIGAVLQVYSGSQGRAMVFCETKRDADELALSTEIKQETHVIHGDIPQDKREMVLKGFRDGRYKCLIATDVAARGLDIPEVDLVVQCCPPKDVESYIHRSGRTGRAGRDGTCVLFFKPNEEYELGYVEQRAGIQFKRIAPPSPRDVIKACAQDAVKTLETVKPAALEHFRDLAEQLVKEKNIVDVLAAALAVISGNSEIKQRSLLSSREGFTTFLFQTTVEMKALGYAWKALERCIKPELKDKISWMTFCADKKGCVFDMPTEFAETLVAQWRDGRFDTLIQAVELPELFQQDRALERHSFGAGGGAGVGQRRSFGRGGGRGGGWSRDFNRNGMMKRNASWNSGSNNQLKTFS